MGCEYLSKADWKNLTKIDLSILLIIKDSI